MARIVSSKGLHSDGWCDQVVNIHVQAIKAVRSVHLRLWFPPKAGAGDVSFSANAGRFGELVITPPRERSVVVEVSFPLGADDVATFSLSCDSLHVPAAPDVRMLSFMLTKLEFA